MDEPLFNFTEIDGLVAYLNGEGPKGVRVFPKVEGVDLADLRVGEKETIKAWFRRCVDKFTAAGKQLEQYQVTENLMILAEVEWGNPERRLLACGMSVLKAESSLDDCYLDDNIPAYYLRMDFDYGTLGPMFTHPLPHIHAWPSDAAPRFAAEGMGDNVVIDFLEWVCRHFYHDKWLEWVDAVCCPIFSKQYSKERDPLQQIFRAFKESSLSFLRERQNDVQHIKKLLKEEKDRKFSLRAWTNDRALISYS